MASFLCCASEGGGTRTAAEEPTSAVVVDSDAQPADKQKGGSSSNNVRQIQHQPYRPDIDGLRCVCVMMVLVYHLSNGTLLAGGFTGVDIFFVISGYVVTGSLLHDQDGQRPLGELLLRFYARRCKRLTPTLVTVMSIAAILYSMACDISELKLAHEYFLTGMYGLVGAANIYLATKKVDYFDEGGGPLGNPFLHLWSLGVEEQFYLLWPLGLYFLVGNGGLTRVSTRWPALAATVGVGVAVSAGLEYGMRWSPTLVFYSFPTRAWQLLAGALTFFLIATVPANQNAQTLLSTIQPWLQLPSLALLTVSAVINLPEAAGELARGILPVAAGVCFIAAGAPLPATSERDVEGTAAHGGWMSRLRRLASLNALLGLSVPRYIGRISYPLYLWHWPAIVIWKACFGFLKTDPLPLWPHSLCVLFISMLLASATFHTVEAGARAWRTKRSLAVIAAALVGVALAVGELLLLDGPLGSNLFVRGKRYGVESLAALPVLPEACKGTPKTLSWLDSLPDSFADDPGRCTDARYLHGGSFAECTFSPDTEEFGFMFQEIDPLNATDAQKDAIAACLARPTPQASDRPRIMLLGDSHSDAMAYGVYQASCANYDFGHFGCISAQSHSGHSGCSQIFSGIALEVLGNIIRPNDLLVLALHTEYWNISEFQWLAPFSRDHGASSVFLGDHPDFSPDPAGGVCDVLSPSDARFSTSCCNAKADSTLEMEPWEASFAELADEYPSHFYHFSYWRRFCGGDPNYDADPRCGADQCSPFVPSSGLRLIDNHHLSYLGSMYLGRQLHEFLAACRLVPAAEASATAGTPPPPLQLPKGNASSQSLPSPSPSRSTWTSGLHILDGMPPYGRGFRQPRQPPGKMALLSAHGMVRTAAAIHGSSRPLPPAAVNESRQAEAVHRTRNAARQKQHTTRPGTRELQPTMDQPYRML